MKAKNICITSGLIDRFAIYLNEEERATATIGKYTHDLWALSAFLDSAPVTKAALVNWKRELMKTYAPASVNSMLAAVNSLLSWLGRKDLCVKSIKIQKSLFLDEKRDMGRQDYCRLVRAAEKKGNRRLSLVMQTICSTGIRVSELKSITVEAVIKGHAEIRNKGKLRTVFLPPKLCKLLKKYIREQKRSPERYLPPERESHWTEAIYGER